MGAMQVANSASGYTSTSTSVYLHAYVCSHAGAHKFIVWEAGLGVHFLLVDLKRQQAAVSILNGCTSSEQKDTLSTFALL